MIQVTYKKLGQTSLEAIEEFRKEYPEYKNTPITFAGRLDPMAEGALLLLIGEDRHKKPEYLKLDKEYVATILLGFETDSHDILGLPTNQDQYLDIRYPDIEKRVEKLEGEHVLPFPVYSSYKIQGKPLFWWARENKLDEIEIPKKKMKVYSVKIEGIEEIPQKELLQTITKRIGFVKRDLRQEKIKKAWREILKKDAHKHQVVRIRFHTASGTYIRSLAHKLGKELGCGAILLHLERTRVGEYK